MAHRICRRLVWLITIAKVHACLVFHRPVERAVRIPKARCDSGIRGPTGRSSLEPDDVNVWQRGEVGALVKVIPNCTAHEPGRYPAIWQSEPFHLMQNAHPDGVGSDDGSQLGKSVHEVHLGRGDFLDSRRLGRAGPQNDEAPESLTTPGACVICYMAVRKGFEPLIRFLVYTLSRRAPSTARTPHRIDGGSCPSRRANVIERTAFGKNFFNLFMCLTNSYRSGDRLHVPLDC